MRATFLLVGSLLLGLGLPGHSLAQSVIIDDFRSAPEQRWKFFADSVMGGVSTGRVTFDTKSGGYARMTGDVSTANNGGFIQIRRAVKTPPADITGVRLIVRGNNQRYYLHLRTSGTILPWQYYQASYRATSNWTEVRIPLERFERSGRLLRRTPLATSLKSVGVVAFGRNHQAKIDVREIGFY